MKKQGKTPGEELSEVDIELSEVELWWRAQVNDHKDALNRRMDKHSENLTRIRKYKEVLNKVLKSKNTIT